jgi:hypothetical protein
MSTNNFSCRISCYVVIILFILLVTSVIIRKAFYNDYYENPITIVSSILMVSIFMSWITSTVLIARDLSRKRIIPLTCIIICSVVGMYLLYYVISFMRFMSPI